MIALHQAKTTEEEIRLLLNDVNPSISDFDRLYQYSNELFELVVKNCEIYWDMLWECKEKLVFISKIAELRLTAENVSEAMFDNPNGADLVWVLKEKALWNKEYLCLAKKYPALLFRSPIWKQIAGIPSESRTVAPESTPFSFEAPISFHLSSYVHLLLNVTTIVI